MAKLDPSNIRDRIFGAEENSAAGLDQEKLKQQQTLAARIFHTPVLSVRETLFPAFSAMGRQLAEMVDKNYRQIYLFSILRFNMTYMVLIDALIGVYDVLNNPLMGIAYDKTRTRWGKSRPYVFLAPVFYFATIAMVFCAKLFFNNDDPNDMRKVLYIFVALFLKETFSTIYTIPLDNMLPLMSPNPKDRMGVGLWQTYFRNWGGDFIAGMIMPLLDLSRRGFSSINPSMIFAGFGIFTAFLGSGSSLLMAVGCQERVLIQPKPAPISKSIFYILKNKYMLRKFLADFSISWWNGSGYNWDVVTQMEIFGGVFRAFYAYLPRQVMQIVSLSFIERFKTMFGGSYRKTVIFMRLWDFLASTLGGVIGSRKMFMKHFWAVSLIFALFDGINCANNAPSTVLENEIDREIKDYTEYMTGERPDGTIGLLTGLISKVTAPLNTLFTLFVLRWSGYDQTQGEGLTANWSQAGVMENYTMYSRVFLLYMAGSFLPQLVQTIPLFFYDLEGKKKEDMYIALNERRALMAKTASEEEIEALAEMLVEETE